MMNDNKNGDDIKDLHATVWIYPQAGGVQLYPKLTPESLSVANGVISLAQESGGQVLTKDITTLAKVGRWASIMTLEFNDTKVQVDFRKPLKWYQRLLPFGVLTVSWKEQMKAEKPFEDYFRNLGLLKK